MKHKYKVIRFVNNKQVCEWKDEEIDPILYLNDYYNFLDTKTFENAYGHGKGSKDYVYEVLKKHLEALEIIKERLKYFIDYDESTKTIYIDGAIDCDNQEYDLLKEVLK